MQDKRWSGLPRDRSGDLVMQTETERRLASELEMASLIFNHIYNGAIVTDAEGYIMMLNEPYGRFLNLDPREQIGRHCTDVVPNTRMHLVARTGEAEINRRQQLRGQEMVVQRIPIKKDGKVAAVFGQVMFKDVRDLGRLARRLSVLENKLKLYEKELSSLRSTSYTLESIKGESRAILRLKEEAQIAAGNDLPVLISGESGTGKELFAQAIHHLSQRRHGPFIRINCAAIPADLFESELFGYEKGAFTGADSSGKPGKFELGNGGTIFLDEIGELPLAMQPKLLRVLEEKDFERVGGTRPIRTDFRLIAATNRYLEEMIAERSFRKDLFYRLNVIPLSIPPLRERPEDIPCLLAHRLEEMEGAPSAGRISPQALEVLQGFPWPGNVRELYNLLERMLSSASGEQIQGKDLPLYLFRRLDQPDLHAPKLSLKLDQPDLHAPNMSLKEIMDRTEKRIISRALSQCRYNKAQAAGLLGIHRTQLYKKMKKHGLATTPPSEEESVSGQ